MTKVTAIKVEKIKLATYENAQGNVGYAVFVYADRNGSTIKTSIEHSRNKEAMNKHAQKHAKKWKVTPVLA